MGLNVRRKVKFPLNFATVELSRGNNIIGIFAFPIIRSCVVQLKGNVYTLLLGLPHGLVDLNFPFKIFKNFSQKSEYVCIYITSKFHPC